MPNDKTKWPTPPIVTTLEDGEGQTYSNPPPPRVHTSTACKHKDGSCALCGTTDRRDTLHTADSSGRGVVGRALQKKKR